MECACRVPGDPERCPISAVPPGRRRPLSARPLLPAPAGAQPSGAGHEVGEGLSARVPPPRQRTWRCRGRCCRVASPRGAAVGLALQWARPLGWGYRVLAGGHEPPDDPALRGEQPERVEGRHLGPVVPVPPDKRSGARCLAWAPCGRAGPAHQLSEPRWLADRRRDVRQAGRASVCEGPGLAYVPQRSGQRLLPESFIAVFVARQHRACELQCLEEPPVAGQHGRRFGAAGSRRGRSPALFFVRSDQHARKHSGGRLPPARPGRRPLPLPAVPR